MTQTFDFTTVNTRALDMVNDFYRNYFKSVILVQEQALEVTKAVIGQVDGLYGEGRRLAQEYTIDAQRTQNLALSAGKEMTSAGLALLNQIPATATKAIDELNGRIEELAVKVETTRTQAAQIKKLESENASLQTENAKLNAKITDTKAKADHAKQLEAEVARLESERAKLERANSRLENKVEETASKVQNTQQIEAELNKVESEKAKLERANTRLETKLENATAQPDTKENNKK